MNAKQWYQRSTWGYTNTQKQKPHLLRRGPKFFAATTMAMSSTTVFTAFLSTKTPSSSPSLIPVRPLPVNLRFARFATYAAASESASQPRAAKGIMKPREVSPAMQEFVGAPMIARTTALKIIWAYIKENNLQDPQNKKIIVCDEKLKTIFDGKDRVGFLEVAKLISPHFIK